MIANKNKQQQKQKNEDRTTSSFRNIVFSSF
jgi:hypothetical protein